MEIKMKTFVTKPYLPDLEEYISEIKEIWDNHYLTNFGPKHEELEENLSRFLDVKRTALFINGHYALESALSYYNFPKDSEVITTPFTFVSTVNAIVRNGLVPVFCDINDKDYTIDVKKIEQLITNKTVAIIPVHVYGNVCDVEEIERIAKKHNLKVIYDAAHAFGVKYKGTGVANFGDMSMFSFHATKVFNTIEGGAICYNDDSLDGFFHSIRDFGITGEETCDFVGGNGKMNEFQACMGLCNLRHIDDVITQRKRVVERYIDRLSNIKGIIVWRPQNEVVHNYSYLPVVFDGYPANRDEIKSILNQHGIYARKYFYPLVSEFGAYNLFNKGSTPIAKRISERILTLPLYPDLTDKEIDRICDIILSCNHH